MASVETYLERYLHELHEIRSSGEATGETSYYPALSELLDSVGSELKPKVRCILILKNRGAGHPDGGLFTKDQFQKLKDSQPLPGQKPGRGANRGQIHQRRRLGHRRERSRSPSTGTSTDKCWSQITATSSSSAVMLKALR